LIDLSRFFIKISFAYFLTNSFSYAQQEKRNKKSAPPRALFHSILHSITPSGHYRTYHTTHRTLLIVLVDVVEDEVRRFSQIRCCENYLRACLLQAHGIAEGDGIRSKTFLAHKFLHHHLLPFRFFLRARRLRVGDYYFNKQVT